MKEQLSACLDGELPAAEFDLLLKRLERDPQLRHSMGRYALIGEALRAARPVCASNDLSVRVAAAIRDDVEGPALRRPAASLASSWLRPAAGMAVAASVAALAIFALQAPDPAGLPGGAERVAEVGPVPGTVVQELRDGRSRDSYIVPTGTPAPNLVSAARLTNYVVAHSEYSSPLGRRTVLSGVLSADRAEEAVEGGTAANPDPQASPQR